MSAHSNPQFPVYAPNKLWDKVDRALLDEAYGPRKAARWVEEGIVSLDAIPAAVELIIRDMRTPGDSERRNLRFSPQARDRIAKLQKRVEAFCADREMPTPDGLPSRVVRTAMYVRLSYSSKRSIV